MAQSHIWDQTEYAPQALRAAPPRLRPRGFYFANGVINRGASFASKFRQLSGEDHESLRQRR